MPSNDADYWNGRFATESYIFGTGPAAFVVDNAHHIPPRSRVLTPADGEGRNSVFLAEMGHRVVATDIAEEAIAKAKKLADARGVSVEFRHVDLRGWQWPEVPDVNYKLPLATVTFPHRPRSLTACSSSFR